MNRTFTRTFTQTELCNVLWDVKNLFDSGRKIAAIKILRAITGLELGWCKKKVEGLSETGSVLVLVNEIITGE